MKLTMEKRRAIRHGKWKEFNKHAVLIAEGTYVNGLKHGLWREYYDDSGALLIEESFVYGVQHGRYVAYHPNGQVLSEGEFRNGLREGYFRIYDEDGNNIRNLLFVQNIQIADVCTSSAGTSGIMS